MKNFSKKNIFEVICALFILTAILSFFLTGAYYEGGEYRLSLIDITFGNEYQNASPGLMFSFIGLVICLISSIIGLIKNSIIARKIVVVLGLVYGILLFFTLNIASPDLNNFKIGIGSILGGIFSILGSFLTLITIKIFKD